MISFEKTKYAQALSTLSDWKVTTVIRTHYYLKPHVVDRKMSKLFRKINGSLFYVTEFDRDAYESYQPSNHLHLISDNPLLTRGIISEATGLNIKSILNVETIDDKEAVCKYLTKQMNHPGNHYNFMF